MNNKVVYFYEGENEKHFIKTLKNNNYINAGKVKKFNLWQNGFEKIIFQHSKKDSLIFIIDTDTTTDTNIFIKNISILKGYNFCLIVQNKNFEDELCKSCNLSIKELLNIFKSRNIDEFKTRFNKTTNILDKLNKNSFNFDNLWISNNFDFIDNKKLLQRIVKYSCKNTYRVKK